MVRNITNAISVQVVTFVLIPIIARKIIHHHGTVGTYIKGVVYEVIIYNSVFHTIGVNLHSPAVILKIVFKEVYLGCAIQPDSCGVTLEIVVFYFAKGNILKKQTIGRINDSPVSYMKCMIRIISVFREAFQKEGVLLYEEIANVLFEFKRTLKMYLNVSGDVVFPASLHLEESLMK